MDWFMHYPSRRWTVIAELAWAGAKTARDAHNLRLASEDKPS